eukprot:9752686-Ditylum_brightwellii.AAC.1
MQCMVKKKSGQGTAYSSMEKHFLCGNMLAVLPVSETGWEKVLQLHNQVYSSKKRTIELLCR